MGGADSTVPHQTPSGKLYAYWENMFLSLADVCYPGMSIADVDLMIWAKQSGRMELDNVPAI
jgi:thermostable 8-oxoguanine DNA glycosylase